MNNRVFGACGEDFAAAYLSAKGHKIILRNYTTKIGEIDIITTDGNKTHFVEVKTRSGNRYGRPYESITDKKLSHIKRVAEVYIQQTKSKDEGVIKEYTIDVIEVMVNHIEGVE